MNASRKKDEELGMYELIIIMMMMRRSFVCIDIENVFFFFFQNSIKSFRKFIALK